MQPLQCNRCNATEDI